MLLLIIVLLLLFGAGGGYYGYSRWGGRGGLGIVGTVVLIALVLYIPWASCADLARINPKSTQRCLPRHSGLEAWSRETRWSEIKEMIYEAKYKR